MMTFEQARRTVARGLWRRYSAGFNRRELANYLVVQRFDHPLDIPVSVDDARVTAEMRAFATHRHEEFLYHYTRPCYIEPAHGQIITEKLFLIEKPYSYATLLNSTPLRSLLAIIRQKMTGVEAIEHVDEVVSLRDMNEGNYWHFYDDTLSKLLLVDRLGVGKHTPILIGERLWSKPFFQAAIRRGDLKARNWMLHNGILRANRVIFGGKMSLQKENFEFALRALDAPPAPLDGTEPRLFIDRNSARGRYLSNSAEVVATLTEYDFRVIDNDALTLDQQIALYAQARYVIGLHGAGLANLIFRQGRQLDLIELFPPDFIHPHYIWLCHTLGYGYDVLVGEAGDQPGTFVVNTRALREKIVKMLRRHINTVH